MLQYFNSHSNTEEKYEVNDFYYRIKKIEKICLKENVDGLLLINGMDARDNTECTKLTNWLLLGNSGLEIDQNEYLEQQLSDLVMFIRKDGLSVYTDLTGYQRIQQYILSLPNLQIFSANEKEDDNKEECELLKITEFYRMMKGVQSVGVLLGKKDKGGLKSIEKWPLIQTYGIQEMGNGFFSMCHKLVDLTDRINQLYKTHDRHSLKTLICRVQNRLTGHVEGAMAQITDTKISLRQQITEDQLVEVFKDTFEIEATHLKLEQIELPRVIFGNRTDGMPCLHFTLETFDLFSQLRCARTYFLTRHVQSEQHFDPILNDDGYIESYQLQHIPVPYHTDESFLINLYVQLIQAFYGVMQLISKDYRNMTPAFIQAFMLEQLKQNVEVTLQSYNSYGQLVPINFKDAISFKLTPYFFLLKLLIQTPQGQLLFAESFILQENCYFLITKTVPYLDIWNTVSAHSDSIQNIKKLFIAPSLGKQLTEPLSHNQLYFPINNNWAIKPFVCTFILHEHGLRIHNDQIGWCVVIFSELSNITFQNNNNWMICDLQKPILLQSLNLTRIALQFTSQSVQSIYLPLQNMLPQHSVSDYIPELSTIHAQKLLYNSGQTHNFQLNQMVNHQFLLEFLESKQLTILNQLKDLKLANFKLFYEQSNQTMPLEHRIGLILVTGVYSTGKNKFIQSLLRHASDNQVYATTLAFDLIEQAALDEAGLINKLEQTIYTLQNTNASSKLCIVVIPYYLNIDTILQSIEGKQLSQYVYTRCVVSKINANNIYCNEHKQIIERLISYSLPGYCQAIIMDSFGNYESDLDALHKTLRTICQGVPIYRITNNVLHGAVAQSIYKDESYNSSFNIYQRTKMAAMRAKLNSQSIVLYLVIFIMTNSKKCLFLGHCHSQRAFAKC